MSDSIGLVLGGLIVVLPVFLYIWVRSRDQRGAERNTD